MKECWKKVRATKRKKKWREKLVDMQKKPPINFRSFEGEIDHTKWPELLQTNFVC